MKSKKHLNRIKRNGIQLESYRSESIRINLNAEFARMFDEQVPVNDQLKRAFNSHKVPSYSHKAPAACHVVGGHQPLWPQGDGLVTRNQGPNKKNVFVIFVDAISLFPIFCLDHWWSSVEQLTPEKAWDHVLDSTPMAVSSTRLPASICQVALDSRMRSGSESALQIGMQRSRWCWTSTCQVRETDHRHQKCLQMVRQYRHVSPSH